MVRGDGAALFAGPDQFRFDRWGPLFLDQARSAHLYERKTPGAIAMIAVYYDETVLARPGLSGGYRSPGVKRATDEFFRDKPDKVSVLYANEYSNGYFRKL